MEMVKRSQSSQISKLAMSCKVFSILASFFMPLVGTKWNIYLSLCLDNFENKM